MALFFYLLLKNIAMTPATTLIHYLQCLDKMLSKIESFLPKHGDVFNAQLHEGMFPLLQQAKIAIGFSLRACCPIVGIEIVSFEEEPVTLAAVKKQLSKTADFLVKIPDDDFENYKIQVINTTAGFAKLNMLGGEYYHQYALPNFMFHLSMVYAIARAQGVPLSKGDFDGYHQYPEKFSFE